MVNCRRLGVQQGSTRAILEHEFFKGIDIKQLMNRAIPAPMKARSDEGHRKPVSSMKPPKKYEGAQDIFIGF